jgi:ubiquinone/menaquinone biosynthesis C-methylase UbiE
VPEEKNIIKFNQDVMTNEGYLYSASDRLSCRLANKRLTDAVFSIVELAGKRVIDVGCGDGNYTMELMAGNPKYILGVDAAEAAVDLARETTKNFTDIEFRVGNIYNLNDINDHFDIAIVRGVLHHLNDAPKAIHSVMSIADELVVIEPNGYNPGLKVIEKLSSYHIEHEEKSYLPPTLDKWFATAGGKKTHAFYCGLVPFFCPNWLARCLNFIEPLVENIPFIRNIGCAVYVLKVEVERYSE